MTQPNPQPQFTHYVSLHNNSIHPAMTSPAGYEDEHPTEWRGATRAEIARYQQDPATMDSVVPKPLPLDLAGGDSVVTPTTLVLQDDEPTTGDTNPVVPEAPVVPPPAAPAPVAMEPVRPAPVVPAAPSIPQAPSIPAAPAIPAAPTTE